MVPTRCVTVSYMTVYHRSDVEQVRGSEATIIRFERRGASAWQLGGNPPYMSDARTSQQMWISALNIHGNSRRIGEREDDVGLGLAQRGLALGNVELLEVIGDVSDERRGGQTSRSSAAPNVREALSCAYLFVVFSCCRASRSSPPNGRPEHLTLNASLGVSG